MNYTATRRGERLIQMRHSRAPSSTGGPWRRWSRVAESPGTDTLLKNGSASIFQQSRPFEKDADEVNG